MVNTTSTTNNATAKHRKGFRFLPLRKMPHSSCDALRFKHLLLFLLVLSGVFVILHHRPLPSATPVVLVHSSETPTPAATATFTTLHNILFSIGSSSASFPHRTSYLRQWYRPNSTRALVFLDKLLDHDLGQSLPPIVVSGSTSEFPYSFPRGRRSAIRIARIVKEVFDRGEPDVRWFVFGDDDTVFFPDNLVSVLSNYDHERWYYLGSRSESHEQLVKMWFDMAYGGGGFAISASLARVLARVLDSCLMRYPHLYGSDARVYACIAELGVGLTLEPGFHQFDVRGSVFGLLTAHPLSPLLSLHHLDAVEPLFPAMNRTQSLQHLFKAVQVDPARMLQQTVCYSRPNDLSVSVAWGYAVQVYEGNELLTDLIIPLRTFMPWRRRAYNNKKQYIIDTRDNPQDPCKRPIAFFFESVKIDAGKIWSTYVKHLVPECVHTRAAQNLTDVRISSSKLEVDNLQQNAPRRQCCDILHPFEGSMFIDVRPCGEEELISMNQ